MKKLEELRDELMFEKKRNTRLARELEESDIRLMDLLKEASKLENQTEPPQKKQWAPIGFGEGDHPDFLHDKEH